MNKPYEKFFEKVNLEEAIYGNNAIVYHRTTISDLINKVYTSGFKPGEGDMYGKGFYSTYELSSQQKSVMKQYGNTIVKFQITLQRFFFFDFDEFQKSPTYTDLSKKIDAEKITKSNFINLQLQFFGMNDIEYKHKSEKYSSEIASRLWKKLIGKVDGIVFTGKRDGKVLVCYDSNRIVPLSFSTDNGKTFEKVIPQNLEYIKKVQSSKDFSTKEGSLPKWVVASGNKPKSFEYDTDEDGFTGETKMLFVWNKGIWERGIWKDGVWNDGTWKNGDWERGTWNGGTWENGTWENGDWKDGTWKNGTWKIGEWDNGTWENGTWIAGYWNNGVWEDGLWRGGFWYRGTWKSGSIYDPKLKKYVKSTVSPKEYFAGKK